MKVLALNYSSYVKQKLQCVNHMNRPIQKGRGGSVIFIINSLFY